MLNNTVIQSTCIFIKVRGDKGNFRILLTEVLLLIELIAGSLPISTVVRCYAPILFYEKKNLYFYYYYFLINLIIYYTFIHNFNVCMYI